MNGKHLFPVNQKITHREISRVWAYNPIYYLLVAYSQREMQGREPNATHLFEAPLRDIMRIGATDGEEISVVKKYLQIS